MKNIRIKYVFFVITALLILFLGCEREIPTEVGVDCYECYQDKPEWVQLNATVTINAENPYVPLEIFIGDYEDGEVDWVDTTWSEDYWVDVKPDRTYSIRAKYKKGNKTIYAIDGDKIKLKLTDTECDQSCYYQKGGYLNVQLQ